MICFPQEISVEASGSCTGSPAGCKHPDVVVGGVEGGEGGPGVSGSGSEV